MEKDSAIIFSDNYQKLSLPDSNKCPRKHKLSWCLFFLVLGVLVVHSIISVWYLKSQVRDLQQKIILLELRNEVADGVLKNKEKAEVLEEFVCETGDVEANMIQCELQMEDTINLESLLYSQMREKENARNIAENALLLNSEENNPMENDEVPLSEEESDNMNENVDVNDDDDANAGFKRKREIRDYNESSAEKNIRNDTENKWKVQKSSTESSSSLEKSSEMYSKERFFPASNTVFVSSTRKPHLHRKHRKSRIGSAERFFTETHSTTTAPIQVRQSRTKITQMQGIDKTIWLQNQKFQQHTSPLKDTITKEEALLKGFGRHLEGVSYDLDTSKERPPDALSYNMITIHFSADTSHYSRERDPHYFGNGRMQIKSEVYKDWKPAHWTQGVGMSKYFHLHQGRVTVSTTGIYLIYAQIQYSNVQEVNGFSVFRNKEVVVQCITTSTHPDKLEIKSNTCGISTTILLQSNDSVCIKDLHHGRYVVLTPEKSYFGLVLLSPFKN